MSWSSLATKPQRRPALDPGFLPAVLWNDAYRCKVRESPKRQPLVLGVSRGQGVTTVFRTEILPDDDSVTFDLTRRYVERLTKFLLWQRGGCSVLVGGSERLAEYLSRVYGGNGERAFDWAFLGKQLFGSPIDVRAVSLEGLSEEREKAMPLGRHLDGNRIGFDLGGSDRKAAAVIDGEVVFSEEIPWDPYFQSDPNYHFEGIRDSLRRAAAHLPSVDAIGGSAAGVYVDNEVRGGSLFRGVPPELFEERVKRIFFQVMEAEGWGRVPWEVVNDGEVTALAGSMSLGANAVLGISMGTSQAAGYVNSKGNLCPWLNELAFAPIDYRDAAPADEWSGDHGCGVQYFSQQAVGRLIPAAGIEITAVTLPEQLVQVQEFLAEGDERAARIYETIGTYLGYAIAHYAEFYDMNHLLILGRVTSGAGGEIIIREARTVLESQFPELARSIAIHTPDESAKRHGQAIAAASLPARGTTA